MKIINLNIDLKLIALSCIFFLGSCSKDDDGVTDSDPISSRFGEFITLPDFDPNVQISSEMLASDEGLYMTVGNTNNVDDWIYRYDLKQEEILKGTWQKIRYNPTTAVDFVEEKTPVNPNSEKVSEHEIFITPTFYKFTTPVFRTMNMASGSTVKDENAPAHDFSYQTGGTYKSFGNIVRDDFGQTWAVFKGETVSDANLHVVKLRYGNLAFNTVCTINAKGILYYSTSTVSSDLYALSYGEQKLFIIKPNGQVITKDLSPYYDASLSTYSFKNKFRSNNSGIYFQFQEKVLKLWGDNLSLFYTIKAIVGGPQLGDFCVDNDYLFASDGTRKELTGTFKTVNIIPEMPKTSNPAILLEHTERTTFFKVGELETSANPSDKYIYVLGTNGKILVVSKHYL